MLLCIARGSDSLTREIAHDVGITERAVQKIVADLETSRHITHRRVGRGNRYRIRKVGRLRHPLEAHCRVADLIAFVELAGAA